MTPLHSSCPDCRAPLPADSPQSLCPACLLRQALASRTIVTGQDSTHLPPPPTPEEIADKFPQFEVTECLGSGGMGVVYKARQKSLDRWVAIKILRPEKTGDERFAERFAREAQTLARLNHPNIVTVFDYGETSGLYYIVMEFVDGVNLRDLLREGKLEPEQALAIVPPICEALQYAHEKGIVHRDIKPENLLLDRDGRIKIADFGIASLVGAGGDTSGTPPYMAPEQQGPSKVDHRADIYALGVVLYEMLTGERPGRDLATPSKKAHTDVRLDEMVMRAMEKDPERRYQSASDFRTMVETVRPEASPPPFHAADPPPSIKVQGMWSRYWWLLALMIPIGILLGLGGGILQGYLIPKKYRSTAIVVIPLDEHRLAIPGEYPQPPSPSVLLSVKLGQLTSPQSLEEVAHRLGLLQRWQTDPQLMEVQLRRMIEIIPIEGTMLVEIQVTSNDRSEAAEIANSLAEVFGTKTKARIHEAALPSERPLQTVLLPFPAKSALIGLIVAVVGALSLMLLAHRRYLLKSGIQTRTRALKIFAGCLLCLVALFYAKPWIFPARMVRGNEGPILGRVAFNFNHPDQLYSRHSIGFPVRQDETSPFQPAQGQRETLKNGRTGWMRARVVSHGPGSPVVVVATSLDGEHWETQEAVLDSWPTGTMRTLEFANGYKTRISWNRDWETQAKPPQGTSRLVVGAGIGLLVLVLVAPLIIALSKARSRNTTTRDKWRRYWWLFLAMLPGGALLGVCIGLIVFGVIPKKYEATTVLQMRTTPEDFHQNTSTITWMEALKSRKTLSEVGSRLNLGKTWNVPDYKVADTLKSVVSVQAIQGTSLIELKVRFNDATLAADIANTLAQVMRDSAGQDSTGGDLLIIHEQAIRQLKPTSPNVAYLVGAFAVVGLAVSPWMALVSILLLGRRKAPHP